MGITVSATLLVLENVTSCFLLSQEIKNLSQEGIAFKGQTVV